MKTQPQKSDLHHLLLSLLTDRRMLALLGYYRRLSSRQKRALLRIARVMG